MAKKRKKNDPMDTAERLAKDVRESAHKIWLAGLGAFDSARDGIGKLSDRMVKQGRKVEERTAPQVKKTAHEVGEALRKEARNLEEQLKRLVNKVDAWRSSPARKPRAKSAAKKKKKAPAQKKAARKKAARKRAAGKKKAAPKKRTRR